MLLIRPAATWKISHLSKISTLIANITDYHITVSCRLCMTHPLSVRNETGQWVKLIDGASVTRSTPTPTLNDGRMCTATAASWMSTRMSWIIDSEAQWILMKLRNCMRKRLQIGVCGRKIEWECVNEIAFPYNEVIATLVYEYKNIISSENVCLR